MTLVVILLVVTGLFFLVEIGLSLWKRGWGFLRSSPSVSSPASEQILIENITSHDALELAKKLLEAEAKSKSDVAESPEENLLQESEQLISGNSSTYVGIGTSRIDIDEKISIVSKLTVESVMSVVVSLAVLIASLYVVLSGHYDDSTQKWAFGIIGSIIGFWVKRGAN